VAAFIKEQFGRDAHPFFVMLTDERVVSNGGPVPEALLRIARLALQRPREYERRAFPPYDRGGGPPYPRDGFSGGGRGGSPPFERFGRGPRGDPFRPSRPAPIVVNGQLAGVVVVPPVAPFPFLLNRYAPTLALVAGGTLIVGALLATVIIFGPTRRRLRELENAARRLGTGDLTARAPSRGGDEVAAVATAFNAMADDLATRAEALAASDRARRQLLADVSHELTTPVTAMRGYLETLTMPELGLDEETRARYLGIIGDETGRLERIIGDLLDLARLEGGGGALVIEPVPVAQLFSRVTARHERACADAGVSMATTIAPGLDAVQGDRVRLEQALQNLAANALRYAPPGTTIDLRAAKADAGTVTLTVTDEGPGIPPEHLPHIFDRFYKVDASRAAGTPGEGGSDGARQTPGGSGLGLSIVKAIVERHGGRASVSSRPGRTTFEIAGLRAAPPPANAE
jgi:signal transduction histidine kinase